MTIAGTGIKRIRKTELFQETRSQIMSHKARQKKARAANTPAALNEQVIRREQELKEKTLLAGPALEAVKVAAERAAEALLSSEELVELEASERQLEDALQQEDTLEEALEEAEAQVAEARVAEARVAQIPAVPAQTSAERLVRAIRKEEVRQDTAIEMLKQLDEAEKPPRTRCPSQWAIDALICLHKKHTPVGEQVLSGRQILQGQIMKAQAKILRAKKIQALPEDISNAATILLNVKSAQAPEAF